MGDILQLLEDTKIQIDFTMLWDEADKAAKKIIVKTRNRGDVEDIRSDLIVKVLEDQQRFNNYINLESRMSPSERRAKLGVSLYRIGIKAFYKEDPWAYRMEFNITESRNEDFSEAGLDESYKDLKAHYSFKTNSMSKKDFIRLLPLIDEENINPEDIQKITFLRDSIQACTPEQREVIYLKAKGMAWGDIAEALKIKKATAIRRYNRANLRQRTYV